MYVNCRRNYDLTCWSQEGRLCQTGLSACKMDPAHSYHDQPFGNPAAPLVRRGGRLYGRMMAGDWHFGGRCRLQVGIFLSSCYMAGLWLGCTSRVSILSCEYEDRMYPLLPSPALGT